VTTTLLTVGHGATDRDELGALLTEAGVQQVVDVRRFPGSRNSPDVGKDVLAQWLPELGVDYHWEQRLGGRRTLSADAPELDPWWRVAAFRAYSAHTRTPEFAAALDELLAVAAERRVSIMCSESVWWRCHRRVISDVAVLQREVDVQHLLPDGRLAPHPVAEGARLDLSGQLYWDGLDAV
jgi:uncharacterized protein (DUF488 family)